MEKREKIEILRKEVVKSKKKVYLCNAKAQMAESVDALVSNTSGATHPGSIPGLGTKGGRISKFRPLFFMRILGNNPGLDGF